jgi:tetratricopeptide (TPR) repeat protein
MELARQVGARQLEADSLRSLGILCIHTDDYTRGRFYYDQALHVCQEIGDRQGEARTLTNLGIVSCAQGDIAEAEVNFEQALRISRKVGDRWGESAALANLGLVSWNGGDYAAARAFYQQAQAISREVGDPQGASIALSNLARISHYLGDDEDARRYGQESLSTARKVGYPYVEGYALTYLGHALVGLGHLGEAATHYQEAVALRRKLGQHNLAMESQAGLARVRLAEGDMRGAQDLADEILLHLGNHGLDGMVEPFQVYLTCYQVLRAGGAPRAPEVLATAYDLLQAQASKISDEATRHSFLENITAHREIVATYDDLQARSRGRSVQVRLPRADAPLGRPLRDDEYTTVVWTVAAPEDADRKKVARRRRRILRLLQEARAQGAAPTYGHLAQALCVSQRTIERDMAALRREHAHLPPTRGKMSD